jgi:KUP system potassium uptake protein
MNSTPNESSTSAQISEPKKASLFALALGALGVVYGDIGTSPLYAMREVFQGHHAVPLNEESIFGVLSLVFWVLLIVVSVKYVLFVLTADNRGEGGILALTALACPQRLRDKRPILIGIGLFGAALLYGDGIITPAISVLGAVEGLKIATPVFRDFVVPIAVGILVGLFAIQKQGTGRIGAFFGPIILVWFAVLGLMGIAQIMERPEILTALSPHHAILFFYHHALQGFFIMGALFLVVTGGEALYADMGHFGKKPIQVAWFTVALPGLVLNYFGQGALLLSQPSAIDNPFYRMAPDWFLYPLIGLATMAAVIASQALISGVFSLTHQAIQLGFCPRLELVHTSSAEKGQIYMPQVNWALLLGTIWLVLTFKTSSNLAAAYGIAVSGTMVITTALMFIVARRLWGWSLGLASVVCGFFFLIDFLFFAANATKIFEGGWVPLVLGVVLWIAMATWKAGRRILANRLRQASPPLDAFLASLKEKNLAHVPGSAVFMVGDARTTPPALVHNIKHNRVVHDHIVVLTVQTAEVPMVRPDERFEFEEVSEGCYRVIARYGFMQKPDVPAAIASLRNEFDLKFDDAETTYFLGRETLVPSANPGMAIWREHLFAFMARNSQRATQFFNIPADRVVEVGITVEL